MIRQIELIKDPVAPKFPGQNSFLVRKPGSSFSGFIPAQGSYLPVYNQTQTMAEQELGHNMPDPGAIQTNEYGGVGNIISPGTYASNVGGVSPTPVTNTVNNTKPPFSLPDYSKLSCFELDQEIKRLTDILTNPSPTARYTNEFIAEQQNALNSAKAVFNSTCLVKQPADVKITATGQDIVNVKASNGVKKADLSNGIPLWLWVAGGALVVIVALK